MKNNRLNSYIKKSCCLKLVSCLVLVLCFFENSTSFQIHGMLPTKEPKILSSQMENTLNTKFATANLQVKIRFMNDAGKILNLLSSDDEELQQQKLANFFKANFCVFKYFKASAEDTFTPAIDEIASAITSGLTITATQDSGTNSINFQIVVSNPFKLSLDENQKLILTPCYYMIAPRAEDPLPGYTLNDTKTVYIKMEQPSQQP